MLSGCFLDAAMPTPFGLHACGLSIALVALRATNERIVTRRRPTLILSALAINFLLFMTLHLWFVLEFPENASPLHGRAFVDLLCSELLLALSLPWLVNLHEAFPA